MKVQLIRPFLGHEKGKVLDLTPGLARTWIDYRRAVEYKDPQPSKVETAIETVREIGEAVGILPPAHSVPPPGKKSQPRR